MPKNKHKQRNPELVGFYRQLSDCAFIAETHHEPPSNANNSNDVSNDYFYLKRTLWNNINFFTLR